jgi:nitroreductase/NAD-dependent dihydropyrimidine dehydrogenase PreA subunit
MSHLIVDERTCRRDGICVETCPAGIIELREEKAVPTPVEGADALCISCGHCVAVCPYGAMSLDTMPSEDCPPVQVEWALSPEQTEHFLRSRRSIRVYRKEPVEKEVLQRLIEMARFAPSGHNAQPVEWLVIQDADEVKAMAGMTADWMRSVLEADPDMGRAMLFDRILSFWDAGKDAICRGAPHLVIAHGPEDNPIVPSACTIALAYLELAAPSLGLGACWAGYFHIAALQWPALKAALELPRGHSMQGAVMVGRPKYRFKRLPLRKDPAVRWR